jgi:hypothetical protein
VQHIAARAHQNTSTALQRKAFDDVADVEGIENDFIPR